MRVRWLIIAVGFAFSLPSCVRSPESAVERRIERVERGLVTDYGDPLWKAKTLSERMDFFQVPGVSMAVINDYRIEWAKGYGVFEAGQKRPISPETLFQAGSIGKLLVAVGALHYVERGALELDGDVNRSLVSWKVPESEFTATEKVTLRRLLSHSAGMTVAGFQGYAQGEEVPDLRQVLGGTPPANSPPIRVGAVPGKVYRYSGGGYVVVQQLPTASGRPRSRA